MNEGQDKGARSIQFTWMLIVLGVVVTTSVIFTLILIKYRTDDIIQQTDARLFMAAEMAREIIGPDYHDQIIDETSVSDAQFQEIVTRNDDLCRRLGLQYLWSVLVVADNRLVFTSATHSDVNDPASPRAAFFEAHHDPASFSPALGSDLTPVFSTFNNEWGQGRQVLIPRRDAQGRTYIFGASIQLTTLNDMVRQTTLISIAIGLGIFCCAFLLSLMALRLFTAPIIALTGAAGRMATGDLDAPLPTAGSRELQSLAHSLDRMRQGLKRQMEVLRESEEKYRVLFDSFPLGITVTDKNGQILETNAITETLVGLPQTEHEERTIDGAEWQLIRPDGSPMPPDEYAAVIALRENRRVENVEMGFVKPGNNGEITWFNVTAAPIPLENYGVVVIYGDITRQKQAEASLKVSEARYKEISSLASDYAYSIQVNDDGSMENEWAFGAFERITGYDPVLIWKDGSVANLFYPDDLPVIADRNKRLFKGETVVTEVRIVTKSGEIKWIRDTGISEWDEQKQRVIRLLGSATDITERKQTEEALRESEERLRLAHKATNDVVWDWDVVHDTQRWNEAGAVVFGWTDIVEAPQTAGWWAERVHPDDRQRVDEGFFAVVNDPARNHWHDEYRFLKTDGSYAQVVDRGYVLRDAAGQATRMIGAMLDISARVEAERKLRQSEERYRRAQALGHVGNWEYNLQTTEFWGSDEARRIYGFPPDSDSFTTDEVENCIPERERVHQALVDLIERDAEYNLEFEIITFDTHERKTIVSIAELERDAAGNPLKVTGVILDITKRKQAEEEVKTALKEKEVLLQELYHRTKNNMNVINSMLSLQAMYAQNPQVSAVFAEMQHRIHTMALVHQMLYQSRNLASIDLNEYISDLVSYLMSSYHVSASRIALRLAVENVTVLMDVAIPCGLILNELISNVFKHAFPENRSGEVWVSARQTDAGEIILQVADNGVGVPAGVDLKKSNSLGLTSVVAIVEHQLGGRVWFDTAAGVTCYIIFQNNLYHPRVKHEPTPENIDR